MSKKNPIQEADQSSNYQPQSEEYRVTNARELSYYHVSVESKQFDPKSGKKLSKPTIQKLTPQEYRTLEKMAERSGLTVIVLHNPEE